MEEIGGVFKVAILVQLLLKVGDLLALPVKYPVRAYNLDEVYFF
jgi:hypothetical protein